MEAASPDASDALFATLSHPKVGQLQEEGQFGEVVDQFVAEVAVAAPFVAGVEAVALFAEEGAQFVVEEVEEVVLFAEEAEGQRAHAHVRIRGSHRAAGTRTASPIRMVAKRCGVGDGIEVETACTVIGVAKALASLRYY